MQLLTVLESTISVVLILALVSILTTAAVEALASVIGARGRELRNALIRMLGSNGADRLLNHPLLATLTKKTGKRPSYLRSEFFSRVLSNLLQSGDNGEPRDNTQDLAEIESRINSLTILPDGARSLLSDFAREANGEIVEFRRQIEEWYDAVMERVEGWYSRKTRLFSVIFGVLIAAGMNIDVIALSSTVAVSPKLRSEFVTLAEAYTQGELSREDAEQVTPRLDELLGSTSGVGWNTFTIQSAAALPFSGWLLKSLGWFLTGLAATLGAPFWFDLLSKFMRVRSAGARSSDREAKKGKLRSI